MRTLTNALGASVVALVGASAYLGWQLGVERSRAQLAETRVAELESRVQRVERERASEREIERATATTAPVAVPPARAAKAQAAPDAQPANPGAGGFIRENDFQLRLSRAPSSRALVRADKIERLKQQYPNLARALGMSETEAADFIGFLADQEQQREIAWAKARQSRQFGNFETQRAQDQKELAQRLGDERLAKFDAYRSGMPDRAQVRSFRSRLGDADALSDSQADALALALQDQREQYEKEIKSEMGGNATFSMSSVNGFSLMTNIAPSNEDGQEKQLVDQIETYNKRAHDTASGLLSPGQLKKFDEYQQAQLTSQRVMIRSMRDTVPAK
jgi:hypothetical protein